LIRHGEPVGGRAYRGHGIDDPLSQKGWNQMHSSVDGEAPWDKIVSSPMLRCSEFARKLSEKHSIPLHIDEQLKEVGFGCWEGRTPDEIKDDNLEEYEAFYRDPVNNRPRGAEPLHEFTQRVIIAYKQIAETSRGQHALIVTHAGVIRAIIAHTLYSEPLGLYRIKVKNAGITRILHDPHGGHLVYHNARLSEMK
jgi:probable phosphoglycerate mutase